jgi:hypothetical protein
MGFVWGALAVGNKVLWAPSVQLREMEDNADWLNDNQANRTYNATIDAVADLGEDGTLNTSVDATADLGQDGSLLSGQLSGQNSPVNGSNYGSNYPSNYAFCACNGK